MAGDIIVAAAVILAAAALLFVATTISRAIRTYALQAGALRSELAYFKGIHTEALTETRDNAKATLRVAVALETIANDRPIVKDRDDARNSLGSLVLGVQEVLDTKTAPLDGEREDHAAGRQVGEAHVRAQLTTTLGRALSTEK